MFWGCISGKYAKGPGFFWEKRWGSITGSTYRERTLPVVQDYMDSHPGLYFQQDNAKPHAAAETSFAFMCAGIRVIKWPPFSLDLNPIEKVWDWLKDNIEAIDSKIHSSYPRLRKAIQQAWEAIGNDRILELVSGVSIRARCQAVIDAKGMNTKY